MNVQLAVRFELSVAVQVTVVVPTTKVEPEAGAQTTGAEPQLSVAVGGVYVTAALQAPVVAGCVMFIGQALMTGSWLSVTVTVKVQAAVFGGVAVSLAVQVTVVTPFWKVEPEAGTQTAVAPGQLSVGVGVVYVATAVQTPAAVLSVMFAGQVMAGGMLSLTVTVKVHIAMLLEVSFAVQVTVVVPLGKLLPEAGKQVTVAPVQLSEAVGTV